MATISGHNNDTNGGTASQTILIPATALGGDVLYAGLQIVSTTVTISNLNGFTLEATLKPTGGVTTLFILSKVLTAPEILAGSIVVTMSGVTDGIYVTVSISSANQASYKDGAVTTAVTASSTTVTCTAVTTSANNALLIMIGCADAATRTVSSWSAPLATEDQEANSGRRLAVASGVQAVAGSSGSKVLTFSGADLNAAYLVAIADATSSGRGRGLLLGVS